MATEWRNELISNRLRATNQRALMLKIIRSGTSHLDADEVYRKARQQNPSISLSTVYRNLRAFKERGLVQEVHFDQTHHHYEVKAAREHHHLLCLGCGKLIEFTYPLSRYLKNRVPEAKDFDIIDTEIHLRGYCAQCRKK